MRKSNLIAGVVLVLTTLSVLAILISAAVILTRAAISGLVSQ